MDNKKLVFDVSSYQGFIDFDKFQACTRERPAAMMVRSGISYGYTDKYFIRNYEGFRSLGYPTIPYHVHRPDALAQLQVDAICRLLDLVKYDGSHAIAPDEELHLGYDRNYVTDQYFKFYDLINQAGIKQATYSAQWFMDSYMTDSSRFKEPKFILAAYGTTKIIVDGVTKYIYREMPTEEFMADYVPEVVNKDNVLMHQFTDRFDDNAGKDYGMESYYLDASRFLGTEEEFAWMFGLNQLPVEEPIEDEPIVIETGIKTVQVGNSSLALRNDSMQAVGWLKTGCKVNLSGETSKGIGNDGQVHTFQKVSIDGSVADEYIK